MCAVRAAPSADAALDAHAAFVREAGCPMSRQDRRAVPSPRAGCPSSRRRRRDEEAQDRGAVAHLVPVHGAVPARTAVHELIAQHVEPVEDEAKGAAISCAAKERAKLPADALNLSSQSSYPSIPL